MIAVNGSPDDYAIMKQVQQLKAHSGNVGEVVPLNRDTDFHEIGRNEKLYIVSHGDRRGYLILHTIHPDSLVSWLIDKARGLPKEFGGIVLLSCYGGLAGEGVSSLAESIANGIKDKVTPGTSVEGATGYSFGSRSCAGPATAVSCRSAWSPSTG